MSSVRLSSGIVGQHSLRSITRTFVRTASPNLNSWEENRYRFIIYPNSVHLGDTLVVSRGKVATCSKNEADVTAAGLGTCTVAIINKPDIPQAFWPGPSLGAEPRTDVTSYDELYLALLAVRDQCLVAYVQVGWAVVGQSYLPFVTGSGNILTKIGG